MNLQDLKDNRSQIIETLTEQVGEESVKEVMNIMVGGLDCCDSIDELIESAVSIFEQNQTKSRRKVSNLASLIGKIEELENK